MAPLCLNSLNGFSFADRIKSRLVSTVFKALYELTAPPLPSLSPYGASMHTLNSSHTEVLPLQIPIYFYLLDSTYPSLCLECPLSLHPPVGNSHSHSKMHLKGHVVLKALLGVADHPHGTDPVLSFSNHTIF